MISSLSDALAQELRDVPEEIQNRVLKVVQDWDNGEIWRKLKRDQDARMNRFYEKFISHGDLVFDIGANVGERTEIFLTLGAEVVAVEPHAGCINKLKNKFFGETRVQIVPKALGNSEGTGRLLITDDCPGLSTLSEHWLRAVRESNRFGCEWTKELQVPVTTLDSLIETFGTPSFIKIDVEGSEDSVLEGLSKPVPALSFEFTPEHLSSAIRCVSKLQSLGNPEFTYSIGETMELHPKWMLGDEILHCLSRFQGDTKLYGDVYVRFQ